MQPRQREVLVAGLAAVAGALDSWAYFSLGHLFIANMTGNTVMLGFAAATRDWSHAAAAGSAIASYALGVFLGALLSRPVRHLVKRAPAGAILWPPRITAMLCLELMVIVVAATLTALLRPVQSSVQAYALVSAGAVAIGLQSAAMYSLKLPGVVTTYITGTWTTIAHGLAQLLDGGERGKLELAGLKRLSLQTSVVAVYCASAAASGLMLRAFGRNALGWLPVALLTIVTALSLVWGYGAVPLTQRADT
jgi:uncharacterized membrane protein YoaK (UPF0700 family)